MKTLTDLPSFPLEITEGADHIDIKQIEADMTLREFLAGIFSYMPAWMRFLYRVRWVFVRLLGMKQTGIPQVTVVNPEDISFTAGQAATFFTVAAADDPRYWFAEASERHLTAILGVVTEPLPAGMTRFYVLTVVHYHHWTGPVYFNVIRPFHHFVVAQMMRSVAQNGTVKPVPIAV